MANNIITKAWIDANDAVIQQKLQPLSDIKVVRTLDAEPTNWNSLLTYTIGIGAARRTINYKVGDEVRVPSELTETGYSYYKLYAINNGSAVWQPIGGDGPDAALMGTIVVNLEAYANNVKTSGSDLAGAIVTVSDGTDSETKTLEAGQTSVTFSVIPLKNYTVSVDSVAGYASPSSQTIQNMDFSTTETLTFAYHADEYTFDIQSNQSNDAVIGAVVGTVSYTGGSQTSHTSVRLPAGTEATVTFPDVTGYKKIVTNVGKAYTVSYQTEIVYVTLDTETDADISEATFTIKDGNDNTLGTGESGDSVKIPYDTTYTVSAIVLSGYQAEDASYTASQAIRNVTLNYIEEIKGVYAYYSDGSLRTIENADSNAIGVAVIDDACSFVIGKGDFNGNFGGYSKSVRNTGITITENSTEAIADFGGCNNTTRIINALQGYTYQSTTGAPAAEWCRTQFNDKGYLPAVGELYTAYTYKTEVDAMMTAVNGRAIYIDKNYWCSTIYYGDNCYPWRLIWNDGSMNMRNPVYEGNTRVFSALYIPVTFILSSSDSTSISGRTVYVIDRTNEVLELTTDSNGQATGMVALGNVEIRVAGSRTLTKSITLEATMRNVTVEICTPESGVFAYYADGSMRSYDDADSNAIGVAVVTSNCSFVIGKTHNTSVKFGGYSKNLSAIGVVCTSTQGNARVDYLGESNTDRIIEACAGYTDGNGYATGAPAAEWARTQFDGKGYLGSLGEWYTAYSNRATIDGMMTKIGGTAIYTSNYHWTSTLYNASSSSWELDWGSGGIDFDYRVSYRCVRAFCAL